MNAFVYGLAVAFFVSLVLMTARPSQSGYWRGPEHVETESSSGSVFLLVVIVILAVAVAAWLNSG